MMMMMMMELQPQDHYQEADRAHTLALGLLTISTERPCRHEELTVMFTQH